MIIPALRRDYCCFSTRESNGIRARAGHDKARVRGFGGAISFDPPTGGEYANHGGEGFPAARQNHPIDTSNQEEFTETRTYKCDWRESMGLPVALHTSAVLFGPCSLFSSGYCETENGRPPIFRLLAARRTPPLLYNMNL
jgi:hypothetical protein